MQEKIILGFLMGGEKTGYQIKKEMESSTQFIFNTSPGSIYPAFKKLEKMKLVEARQIIQSGRLKNIYYIKPTGREAFLDWMRSPSCKTQIFLLKMFFFSLLDKKSRAETTVNFLECLKKELAELKSLDKKMEDYDNDPFSIQTLKYGIAHLTFLEEWFEKFSNNL
ncbi:helix-turn-helix transcriptional regulator [candidate division WOR-3 bacterium]|nr:helix-turn-helix transcriptional regulator [candidate division WOR-3 bacterium]